MFNLSVPWWELILRAVVIYLFLLVTLRLSGKRHIGQLAPFDFVLLLSTAPHGARSYLKEKINSLRNTDNYFQNLKPNDDFIDEE